MSAIKDYCNIIYEYMRLYGEEHIAHVGYQVEEFPSKQEYPNDYKPTTRKRESFEEDPVLRELIGGKCFEARQECFNEIKKELIMCGTPIAKEKYAQLVIEDMSYVILNHSIAQYDIFERIVLNEVFGPVLGIFQKENINIYPFLDLHRELGENLLSLYMPEKKDVKRTEKKRKQTNFEDLFYPEHREQIPSFIKRLEDKQITKDGIFNCRKRNYLAKLICYMQDKNIIKNDSDQTSLAKCFYEYFGKKVSEKAGENIVTISNVRKTLGNGVEGLSEDEKSEFLLICSVFISRKE